MDVTFSKRGTTLIAKIRGELDHHTAEYIRRKIDSEIMKSFTKNVIFDFSDISFMDSSGIGVIMGRYKNIRQLHGRVSLVNIKPQLRRIVDMSGILKYVSIHDNVNDAINTM